ncbi:hypothetical protein [Sphingomonas panaciterrae]|uniref:hypothetical protein n=1 Tax=Sphingomonas panaciterrae TaxID=1462999 RepID=UPI002FEFEC76
MAGLPFVVVPQALAQITCGNERAEAPAGHLGEFLYRGMVWRSNGPGSLWVTFQRNATEPFDFVGILGASARPGTTLRVRVGGSAGATTSAPDYDSGALPFISPAITRRDGLYHAHHELGAARGSQWVRIDIGGHTGDFEASMLVIGLKRQVARYYETSWRTGVRDLGSITIGRNGVPGISLGTKLRTLEYTLGWVSEEEAETMLAPLDELLGRTTPCLTCFDPEPTAYRQRRTFFGWNEEQPSIGKVAWNRYERAFQVLSLF